MADSIDEVGFDSCDANPEPPTGPNGCTTVENCVDPDTGEPQPLLVQIVGQSDVEPVCDETTDTWHYVTFVDGVAQPGTTDSGIPCSDPPPADIEPVEECRNDTIWNVWYSANPADGTLTEISAADTGRPCADPIEQVITECCPTESTVVEYVNSDNSTDLTVSVSGAGDVIKIGLSPGQEADADAVAQAIADCLAAGNEPFIEWTTTDGGTGSGTITGETGAFPNFSGPGTFDWGGAPGDPGQSGKLNALTVTCSQEGECVPALNTVGCHDERRDDLLAGILTELQQPDVTADVEYVCNVDTGVFDQVVTTYADGVQTGQVVTATPVSCDPETFDYEQPRICRDGTWHVALNQIAEDGTVTELSAFDTGQDCPPPQKPDCVESQEWTYGIDNTGTSFRYVDATYQINLSDGSTLQWTQSAASNGGWTAQLTEWAANIQAAANAAGLLWFAEPRAVNNVVPTDISGGYGAGSTPTGLPGAPSVPVAVALIDGGMAARYVNIQICPGQPVPVSASVVTVADQGVSTSAAPDGYALNTAGAVLGPIQKFFVCRTCGEEPVWFLDDGVTEASPGQIPNCWEPCGTLSTLDAPPDRECEFEFTEACDNNNSADPDDWTNLITRRATICNGQITLDYLTPDPSDSSAFIPYALVGDFVDCATGEPIPEPVPPCSEFELATLYTVTSAGTEGLVRTEWDTGQPPAPGSQQGDDGVAAAIIDDLDPATAAVLTGPAVVAGSLETNDSNNVGGPQDIEVREGFIVVETPFDVYWATNSEGALRVELGQCCGPLVEQFTHAKTVGSDPTPTVSIPRGIHRIRLTNLDLGGGNSNWNAVVSFDGGVTESTDNTPDGVTFWSAKPVEQCVLAKVCEDTGDIVDLFTGQPIDTSTVSACSIACEPAAPASDDPEPTPHVIEDCDGNMYGINPVDGSTVWGPIVGPGAI